MNETEGFTISDRYAFRGFRVGPGEHVLVDRFKIERYINRVGAPYITTELEAAPIFAAIERGEWIEMSEGEIDDFRESSREYWVVDGANRSAAFAARGIAGELTRELADQNLPASPGDNLARIRQLVKTWRR